MKTLFVPGWMKSVSFYGSFDGLDIWKKDFVLTEHCPADCVVAHSMGAAYALAEEKVGDKNTRYYLVNPVLMKMNFFSWLWRWIRCAVNRDMRLDRRMSLKNIFSAIGRAMDISRYDIEKVIGQMSPENIVIVKGERDNYFCDQGTVEVARKYGIKVIEAEGLGHEWDERYGDILNNVMI